MKTKQTLKAIFWFCTFFSFYSLHAQQLPDRLTIGDSITIEFMGYSKLDGLPLYYTTDNTIAAKSIGTNKVHPNGSLNLNLSGEGKVVGVWDGGAVRATHQELVARVTQMDGVTALNNHATHVAGTIGASGVYAPAKGMAFDIDIHAYNWENDEAEMTIAAANGLQVSNHSYGLITGWFYNSEEGTWYWYGNVGVSQIEDYKFGFYSSQARDWDEIAYNAPDYLIVKSAGNERNDDGPANGGEHYYWNGFSWTLSTTNRDKDGGIDGYDCIAHAGVSKNVLTVGAVHDIPNAYNQPSDVVMSTFSSWGNTDDGRIKPDIVANGVGLVSPLATTDNQYGISSGTSMSSPSVSGSLILLQEHHENLYGSSMKAATLKGLVIHTADEAGAVEGPDHQFGWGLMNTAKAATVISNNSLPTDSLIEANLSDSDNYTLTVNSDSTSPLVATLSWTDIPGTIPPISLNPTDLILVNDLDMCLTNTATGETFHPYILNPDSPSAPATTGDNFRDNVEKIYLSAPDAGEYTLTISHKNSLANGGQDFSLILSGMSGSDCIIAANFNYSTNDLTVDFTDLSIEGDTYNWNFGDDSSSSEQNPSHIYTEEGTYTVCLTVSNGCGSDTKCEEIVVPPMVNYFCSRWTNYRNSAIRGIAEEGDFLWLATDEGVVKVSTLDTTHTYYNGSNVSLPHNPNNLFTSYNGIYQDIAIDVKGNKWIASTEGVVKFDNTHWILYSQAYSSLFSGVVRTIETDNVGNVWAGTSLGKLLQFDGNNWTEFYSATDIRDIHIEEDGKIWLASFGGGVYHYNGTDWTVYTHDDTALLPSDNRTLSIDKDNLGNTWIGTSTGGLVKFDGTNWTTYTTSNTPELPSNSIGNLYIDSTGGIWMGFSGAKIVQFDGGNNWTVHTMTTTENTFFYYPISIHIDNNDNIWTGALHGRLHKFDSTDFEEYILLFPFGSGESITIDAASGNIWATTSSTNFVNYSSVRMFDGFEWKVYTPFNSNLPTTSRIEHISVATNGNVWGVAFGVGIVRFDGNNWTVYDSSNSPISSSTLGMTLVTDLLGNVWVESANGLAIYDGNSWTTQSNYGNLITDNIGGVWAWSSTQIAKYDGSNWQTYPITVIDGYSLLSAAIKDEHEVWIGTTDGVIKLDAMNDELEAMYNTDNSNLSNDYIYDVEISNDGRVWVGANIDGMFSFDGTNWQSHYNATTTSHGAVNQTYDIVIDANQDIWVANSYAISHYYRGLSSDFIINEAELEVQFHSLEPNAFTYFWNFGDGTTSTDYAPNHVYQNSGTYNVCLTVTNSCENKTTCQAIEVEELIPINYGCSYWVDYTDASIRGIAEEGDFLWLATDEGIIKVNKLDSTALYYNSSNTNLRYNYAGDIAIDSEGNKWIASSTEVVKYDNTTWKRYNSQYSSLLLSASTIETIEVDSEDNIWVGNSIGRLLKFDGNNWTQVYATTGRIEGIHIENDGKIWLASFGGGVHYFDGNTWNVYNHANTPELPSDDRIWKIVKDGLGNIWIGTFTGGLVKFDGTNWLAYTTNNTPELPSNSIGNLDIDSTGDIWMGFSNAKVVQFDGSNNWTVHTMTTTENTFFYHPISIYIDNSDNAWTGVLYGRLHKFDGNDFEEYPLFFPFGSGESITIDDASGNIW
ncbi:MAG: S8 family serine peptidase, partial [Chitinophagales bacterium]